MKLKCKRRKMILNVLAIFICFTLCIGNMPTVVFAAPPVCDGHVQGTVNGLPACVDAGGNLHICENNFPDESFRNYLADKFDTDANGYFSAAENDAVKDINTLSPSLSPLPASVDGVKFFSKLETLKILANGLTDLDVSDMPALKSFQCTDNASAMGKVNASNCPALTEVNCLIKSDGWELDVSDDDALTSLTCNGGLASLDVSGNSALEKLDCSYNPDLTELDVSDNINLTDLGCTSCALTDLDLSNNTKLRTLGCGNHFEEDKNNIPKLDVSNLPELERVNAKHLKMSEIDLTNTPALKTLVVDYNNLTTLDVSANTALESLDATHNKLQKVNVSDLDKLQGLRVGFNKLPTLDLSGNPELFWLWAEDNELTSVKLPEESTLAEARLDNNKLPSLDLSKQENLEMLYVRNNELTELDLSNNPHVSVIEAGNNHLTSLNLDDSFQVPPTSAAGGTVVAASPDQTDDADKKNENGTWTVDLGDIIGMENIGRVTMTDDGVLDPATGKVSYPNEPTQSTYLYDTGVNEGTVAGGNPMMVQADGFDAYYMPHDVALNLTLAAVPPAAPATGDSANMALWIALMLISALGLCASGIMRTGEKKAK